jgi:hypothetical protein
MRVKVTTPHLKIDGQIWDKQRIVDTMLQSDKALMTGLLKILGNQTSDEQRNENVKYENGVGFNRVDAYILTSIANQYTKQGFISPKQLEIVRKRMPKYAGQLYTLLLHKHSH